MPNRYLKGKARLRKQAATHRRFQEKLKNEVDQLREKLIAAIDNSVPISAVVAAHDGPPAKIHEPVTPPKTILKERARVTPNKKVRD